MPPLEPFDRDAPLILRAVGVQRGALTPGGRQLARQPVGADLRPREDQHRAFGPPQVVDQPVELVVRRRPTATRWVIVFAGALRWPTCTYFGVAHDLQRVRTTSSGIVAEKSSVWRDRRQRGDDAAHVGPEAHVHHAVGFVEHEQLDAAQVGVLLPHVIHQPARRGDDDVDAGLERALLHAHLDAAVDRRARDGGVVGEAVDFVLDLHRELARRREHQHAALARRPLRRSAGDVPRVACSSRCSVGTTNAAVLPVPVSAQAIRSWPASASGMTALWIGRVSVKPRSRMPSSSRGSRLSDANGTGVVSHGDRLERRRVASVGGDAACGCAPRPRRVAAAARPRGPRVGGV